MFPKLKRAGVKPGSFNIQGILPNEAGPDSALITMNCEYLGKLGIDSSRKAC
jgi:hypothetical protein